MATAIGIETIARTIATSMTPILCRVLIICSDGGTRAISVAGPRLIPSCQRRQSFRGFIQPRRSHAVGEPDDALAAGGRQVKGGGWNGDHAEVFRQLMAELSSIFDAKRRDIG